MPELSQMKTDMNDAELVQECENRVKAGSFMEAAICAFVLARRAQKNKDERMAKQYGARCLEFLEKHPTETLEQCSHPYFAISGILIPGLFHEGTVRRELAPLAL